MANFNLFFIISLMQMIKTEAYSEYKRIGFDPFTWIELLNTHLLSTGKVLDELVQKLVASDEKNSLAQEVLDGLPSTTVFDPKTKKLAFVNEQAKIFFSEEYNSLESWQFEGISTSEGNFYINLEENLRVNAKIAENPDKYFVDGKPVVYIGPNGHRYALYFKKLKSGLVACTSMPVQFAYNLSRGVKPSYIVTTMIEGDEQVLRNPIRCHAVTMDLESFTGFSSSHDEKDNNIFAKCRLGSMIQRFQQKFCSSEDSSLLVKSEGDCLKVYLLDFIDTAESRIQNYDKLVQTIKDIFVEEFSVNQKLTLLIDDSSVLNARWGIASGYVSQTVFDGKITIEYQKGNGDKLSVEHSYCNYDLAGMTLAKSCRLQAVSTACGNKGKGESCILSVDSETLVELNHNGLFETSALKRSKFAILNEGFREVYLTISSLS